MKKVSKQTFANHSSHLQILDVLFTGIESLPIPSTRKYSSASSTKRPMSVASRQLDDTKNSAEKIVQLVYLVKIGSESI